MYKINNVVITDDTQNKSIIVSWEVYENNKSIFNGVIGKRMINKLIARNINFTLIGD